METYTSNKIPETISPEAKKVFQKLLDDFDPNLKYPEPTDFALWEKMQFAAEIVKTPFNEKIVQDFGVKIVEKKIKNVSFLEVYPKNYQETNQVIIYLHGGGYTFYSAKTTLTASVPIAAKSRKKVVVLDYPLAPHADYQTILQSFVCLFDHLLKSGYDAKNIAIYGDSAGGGLTAGGLLKLKNEGFPMPASIVLWSPWADLSGVGDTYISLADHDPKLEQFRLSQCASAYAPPEEFQNPYVSPIYGKYDKEFPPTLIQIGTREIFLSDAVRLFQKMDAAKVDVTLDAYEGMWHVWQKEYTMPEAKRAILKTCDFFERHWK